MKTDSEGFVTIFRLFRVQLAVYFFYPEKPSKNDF